MPISYELAAKEYENVQKNLERAQLLSAFLLESLCRADPNEELSFSSTAREGFRFLLAKIAADTAEAACNLFDLKPVPPQEPVPAGGEKDFAVPIQ